MLIILFTLSLGLPTIFFTNEKPGATVEPLKAAPGFWLLVYPGINTGTGRAPC